MGSIQRDIRASLRPCAARRWGINREGGIGEMKLSPPLGGVGHPDPNHVGHSRTKAKLSNPESRGGLQINIEIPDRRSAPSAMTDALQ